jgi:hypothetical protein
MHGRGDLPGLKDNEIQELVNELRDRIPTFNGILQEPIKLPEMLREVIVDIVVGYLESKNLRIDK